MTADTKPPFSNIRVCWIGNPRYSNPLNPTDDQKWRLLVGLGIQIDVIAFAEGLRPRRFHQNANFWLLPQLPTPILRYLTMLLSGTIIGIWLALRGTSAIIAQSPYEGAVGALIKNLAKILGRQIALIVETHGDFEQVVFQQRQITFKGLYRRLMSISARYGLRHADALRAISAETKQQLQAYAPDKPIVQFMAWTDTTAFTKTPRAKSLTKTLDILYAGVLTPLKNVHVLIAAFAQIAIAFPESHLWLVGKPQNPDYAAQLHQQVTSARLNQRVHFVGNVSQHELAEYMGRVRVLVLPSSTEGLGRVLVEAMLCGTPVIGSNVGGIPDVIQEGINGYLVPAGDADKLAERLQLMLTNPNIEEMGQQAQHFAQHYFSPESYADGYQRLLEAALNYA